MKIFNYLYPDAPKLQRRILKSASKAHRSEWLETDSLHDHYKIAQKEIDDVIEEMLNVKRPLIMIDEKTKSIRLTDFGRAIIL